MIKKKILYMIENRMYDPFPRFVKGWSMERAVNEYRYLYKEMFGNLAENQRKGPLVITPVSPELEEGRFLRQNLSYRSARIDRLLGKLGCPIEKYLMSHESKIHPLEWEKDKE